MNTLDLSDPFSIKDPFNPQSGFPGITNDEPETYKLHLRVQQRNARQRITTLAGFPDDYDLKKLSQDIKRKLCCNGAVVEKNDGSDTKALQFSGDQRQAIANFLVEKGIVTDKKDITIHGY